MSERLDIDHAGNLLEQASAVFNEARTHRYALTRTWGEAAPAVFVMLNPSTADALVLDPTVRRCISFAKREGCGGLTVLNLFAFRSTDPRGLKICPDPVGPSNDRFIRDFTADASLVVAAWGVHGHLHGRAQVVTELLADVDLRCLGVTKDGSPKHPLYVSGNAPLVRWPAVAEAAA